MVSLEVLNGPKWRINQMAIQFLVRFLNGQNKMVVENGWVVKRLVLAKVDHLKTETSGFLMFTVSFLI
jgi:hypothetical protein